MEFTYGEKQYVMQGGVNMLLSDVLDEIGIVGHIEDLDFSDWTLLDAYHSEEDIWYIYAPVAFSSEEWMRVTVDGITYEIIVTDAYIGDNGGTSHTEFAKGADIATILISDLRNYAGRTISTTLSKKSGTYYYSGTILKNEVKSLSDTIAITYPGAATTADGKLCDVVIVYSNIQLFGDSRTDITGEFSVASDALGGGFPAVSAGILSKTSTYSGSPTERYGVVEDISIYIYEANTQNPVDGTFFFTVWDLNLNRTNQSYANITQAASHHSWSETVVIDQSKYDIYYIGSSDSLNKLITSGNDIFPKANNGGGNSYETGLAFVARSGATITAYQGGGYPSTTFGTNFFVMPRSGINHPITSYSGYGGSIQTTTGGKVGFGDVLDGGKVDDPRTYAVPTGKTVTYTMKPNDGFVLNKIYVDNAEVAESGYTKNEDGSYSYTFESVSATHKISVSWKPQTTPPSVSVPVGYIGVQADGTLKTLSGSVASISVQQDIDSVSPVTTQVSTAINPPETITDDGTTYNRSFYVLGAANAATTGIGYGGSSDIWIRYTEYGMYEYSVDNTNWSTWAYADENHTPPTVYAIYTYSGTDIQHNVFVTVTANATGAIVDSQMDIEYTAILHKQTWTMDVVNPSQSTDANITVTETQESTDFKLKPGQSRTFTLHHDEIGGTIQKTSTDPVTGTIQTQWLEVVQKSVTNYHLAEIELEAINPASPGGIATLEDSKYQIYTSGNTAPANPIYQASDNAGQVVYSFKAATPPADTEAEFINTRDTVKLTLEKILNDASLEQGATKKFTFTIRIRENHDHGEHYAMLGDYKLTATNDLTGSIVSSSSTSEIMTGPDGEAATYIPVPVGCDVLFIERLTEEENIYNTSVTGKYDQSTGDSDAAVEIVRIHREADREYKIENVTGDATVTYTNTLKPRVVTIRKVLIGDSHDAFRFQVTLKDKNGEALSGYKLFTDERENDRVTDANGQTYLYLHDDESLELSVPYGASLEVKEVDGGIFDEENWNYSATTIIGQYSVTIEVDGTELTEGKDNKGNVYQTALNDVKVNHEIVFTNLRPICKIKTDDSEKVFTSISDAVKYAKDNQPTSTIEMLVDYNLPETDKVEIPAECNITLTTAAKTGDGYLYTGIGDQAVITRAFTGDSMITSEGKLTISGITLDGNKQVFYSSNKGGIINMKDGTLTLGDGAVLKNSSSFAADGGGAIYMAKGNLTVGTGSLIDDCDTLGDGGAICIGGGTIDITGTISNCFAKGGAEKTEEKDGKTETKTSGGDGGAIKASSGTINLNSGALLTANLANGSGGAIYASGTVNVNNGSTISDNNAVKDGGGIYGDNKANLNVTGGIISGNSAGAGGGGIAGQQMSLIGGTIKENAARNGGGISISGKTQTISDSVVITGNNASNNGGAIYATGTSETTISGGMFTENTAKNGGAIYGNSPNKLYLTGGIIQNNQSEKGGIYSLGTIYVSGSPVVNQNTNTNSETCNLYIDTTKTLVVNGELTGSAEIGIYGTEGYREPAKQFGTAARNNSDATEEDPTYYATNLNAFVNDILKDPDGNALRGTSGTGNQVIWDGLADLTVTKNVSNGSPDRDFIFTFHTEGTDEGASFTCTKGTETGTIKSGGQFTLKNGESITIKDIPKYYNTSITEITEYTDAGSDTKTEYTTTMKLGEEATEFTASKTFQLTKDTELLVTNTNMFVEIEQLTYSLISGADLNTNIWTATNPNPGHMFMFEINYKYNINGDGSKIPAGMLKFRIPMNLLIDESGKDYADQFDMSVPTVEQAGSDNKYAYRVITEDGMDYLEIINVQEIAESEEGYFTVGYSTTRETFYYPDMGENSPFDVTMFVGSKTITEADVEGAFTKDKIYVWIDTQAEIESTVKKTPSLSTSWSESWGNAEKPENADDYFYLVWEIESVIAKPVTEFYTFSLEDTPVGDQMSVVGYRMSGTGSTEYTSVGKADRLSSAGTRYDYVLTKFERFLYEKLTEDEILELTNCITATVTVLEGDKDTHEQEEKYSSTESTYQTTYTLKSAKFTPPLASFNTSKRGNTTSYLLDEFKSGQDKDAQTVSSITGLSYRVDMTAYPYEYTLEASDESEDSETVTETAQQIAGKYGKVPVYLEMTDDKLILNSNDLKEGDYEFSGLRFNLEVKAADLNDTTLEFVKRDLAPSDVVAEKDYHLLNLWVKVATTNGTETVYEWKQAGTYDMYGKQWITTSIDETYINKDKVNGTSVTFNNGVLGYRFTANTVYYYLGLQVFPTVTLNRVEDTTLKYVEDKDDGELLNQAVMIASPVSDSKEDDYYYANTVTGTNHIYPEKRVSKLDKMVVTHQNDTVNRVYNMTWRVSLSETLTLNNTEYVTQSNGTFFDLLPSGTNVDLDSVLVQTEDGFLDPSNYTASVQDNFNGSGRTLLTVQVNVPGKYYYVFFTTPYTWEAYRSFGKDLWNPVAYRTGNATIADGVNDDEEGIKKTISHTSPEYLLNLYKKDENDQSEENKNLYLFKEVQYPADVLTSATTGLEKRVREEDESEYTGVTHVGSEDVYAYRLAYSNGHANDVSNIIFYDNLETGTDSQWQGNLQAIDVTAAVALNIIPKVYYRTEKADIQIGVGKEERELPDLTSGGWTLAENSPSGVYDLSDKGVKAIAVDLSTRKKTADEIKNDGTTDTTDFTLLPGGMISVLIYMKSPAADDPDISEKLKENTNEAQYLKTYNDVFMSLKNGETFDVIQHGYTTVNYRVTANLAVHKYNADTLESIGDITFRLTGQSAFGTRVDKSVHTSSTGEALFEKLEKGTYYLYEEGDYPDWLPDHTDRTVIVYGDGTVSVDGVIYGVAKTDESHTVTIQGTSYSSSDYTTREDGAICITKDDETLLYSLDSKYSFPNTPRAHADIKFTKNILGSTVYTITGANFKLSGTSDYGNEVLEYAASDENGIVLFENVEKGEYDLVEVETPEGYILSSMTYKVIVDGEGNWSIRLGQTVDAAEEEYYLIKNSAGEYSIPNEPYHELVFYKVQPVTSEDEDPGLNGATFKLSGTSDNGITLSSEREVTTTETDPETGEETTQTTIEAVDGLLATSNSEMGTGTVHFTGLESGTYILEEFEAPNGYVKNDAQWIVTIGRDGEVTIEGMSVDETGFYSFVNYKENTIIQVKKVWEDGAPDDGVEPTIVVSTTDPKTIAAVAEFKTSSRNSIFGLGNSINQSIKHFTRASMDDKPDEGVWEIHQGSTPIYGWMDIDGTFYWASNARKAKLTGKEVFQKMKSLETVNLTGIDTSEVDTFENFFSECINLSEVKGIIDVSGHKTIKNMFSFCYKLSNLIDFKLVNTDSLEDMSYVFSNCQILETVDLSTVNTSGVKNMSNLFYHAKKLSNVGGIENWNVSNVTDFSSAFSGTYFESLDLSRWNTENATNMSSMFVMYKNNNQLKSLKIPFQTFKVVKMQNMFDGCNHLGELDLTSFTTSPDADVTNSETYQNKMFNDCGSTIFILPDDEKFTLCSDTKGSTTNIQYKTRTAPFSGSNSVPSGYNSGSSSGGGTMIESKTTFLSTGENCEVDKTYATDTWLYTFSVPGEEPYIWEDYVPEGYEITTSTYEHESTVGIGSTDDPIQYSALNEGDTATITNKKSESSGGGGGGVTTTYGSLAISKNAFYEDSDPVTDMDFTFTIALKYANGESISARKISYTLTNADETTTTGTTAFGPTGEAKITLRHGQTITFNKIPSGYLYEVTEAAGSYTTEVNTDGGETYAASNDGKVNGAITANNAAVVKYKNIMASRGTQDIKVEKKVKNDKDNTYDFTAALTNLVKRQSYSLLKYTSVYNEESSESTYEATETYIFKANESGTAYVSFTLADDEYVIFKDVPVEATYQITEKGSASYSSKYMVTNSAETGIIKRATSSAATGTSLSTATETVDEGEDITITFTNTERRATQNLTIQKVVDSVLNGDYSKSFDFTITFENLDDSERYASSLGSIHADQNGLAVVPFSLNHGSAVTFNDIPVGATYVITETNSDVFIASYKITNYIKAENVEGTQSDTGLRLGSAAYNSESGDELKKEQARDKARAFSTQKETVDVNEDAIVIFTNIRPSLTITKTITGEMADFNQIFQFTLTGDNLDSVRKTVTDGAEETATVTMTTDEEVHQSIAFSLGQKQSITLIDLPVKTSLTLKEDNGYYQTTFTPGIEGFVDTATDDDSITFKLGAARAQLDVENNLKAVSPTDYTSRTLPYLLLLMSGVMMLAMAGGGRIVRRRRETIYVGRHMSGVKCDEASIRNYQPRHLKRE